MSALLALPRLFEMAMWRLEERMRQPPEALPRDRPNPQDPVADFEWVYRSCFQEVLRWARALGGPGLDHEDIAQDVFLVVRKKLPSFDGQNLAGWLYRITSLKVKSRRRAVWLRRVTRLDDRPEAHSDAPSPALAYERAEDHRLLQKLLAKMSDRTRATFVLFEIEGYSGEEIAQLHQVPVNTVWTRLHAARKQFMRLVAEEAMPTSSARREGAAMRSMEGK